MINKRILFVSSLLCLWNFVPSTLSIFANDTSESSSLEESTENNSEETFQIQTATDTKTQEITFEEANILSFNVLSIDRESSERYIWGNIKVFNEADKPIDYLSADFSYVDNGGNIIDTDGRFLDFQLLPDTSGSITSSSDASKDLISDIKITGYYYISEGIRYDVDLELETVNIYSVTNKQDLPFEEAHILDFNYTDNGYTSVSYNVDIEVSNNGTIPLKRLSVKVVYLDENGNHLDNDGRSKDEVIQPGNYVIVGSYGESEEVIGGYAVYQYDYTLVEPDDNGFNHYKVDLQTKSVEGFNRD